MKQFFVSHEHSTSFAERQLLFAIKKGKNILMLEHTFLDSVCHTKHDINTGKLKYNACMLSVHKTTVIVHTWTLRPATKPNKTLF